MNDRTMAKVRCDKELLSIRTVSWGRKSPFWFAILRSELQQLEQQPKNRLISSDCGSFAVLWLTQGPDGMKMLEIRFTWLQEIGAGKVHGWQENIRLPYEPFHVFVENGEDMDGAEWRHLSVPEMLMPRYEFHSRKNLHEVARRPVLRRKLGRVLGRHFQWRGTEKIVIYDDGQPYSFFFEEYTPYGRGYYTNIKHNPLKDDDRKAMSYRAPDPDRNELYTVLQRLLDNFGKEYYIIGRIHCTIFESTWALRGLETLMMDMYINPEDDMGAQKGLMIDPELWKRYFKARMADIIHTIKDINPNIKVAYHSDGCVYAIIPDLIEIGVDVLNPIQTEGMDPDFLKDSYGDKLSFFGGIAVQSTLPMGKRKDIQNEFDNLKNTLGRGGGWLCAPTHHIQMDTPMDNFFTLLEAIGIEDKRK